MSTVHAPGVGQKMKRRSIFFECQFAREVWEASCMTQWTQTLLEESILEHFKRLFTSGSKEQCALMATLCWNLWNRRNNWVWNRIAGSVFGTTSAAMNLLVSWKTNHTAKLKATVRMSMTRWEVSPRHWVK